MNYELKFTNIGSPLQTRLAQFIILNSVFIIFLSSCSVQKQIAKSAKENVLSAPALQTAHIGISIYEPGTNKYWFNYQGDKYFVPASNTKIPTCYAAMKYLGDSLVGARLAISKDSALELYPTGDPTFLHPEFVHQRLFNELKKYNIISWNLTDWRSKRWGNGWSWNDYTAPYMAERSAFPIYGNLIKFSLSGDTLKSTSNNISIWFTIPDSVFKYDKGNHTIQSKKFLLERNIDDNIFHIKPSTTTFTETEFPFRTDVRFVSMLLEDTLNASNVFPFSIASDYNYKPIKRTIHSQPTDSLLKPMMHRSDNFFAEQSLLMVSNEMIGVMNDEKIIDTLLKTDFKDLPQKPRWVDGSGLSRYNLFTPQDLVTILTKMKNEFGMERIKVILPTGGEGTISSYYKADSGYIYAKTGTLSGVVALSGFLYTKKNKLLVFSVLVNNHQASATEVRRAVEKFIEGIRSGY
jgi:D-alanyl-D-alanine carboxypeptidase/D-alanyl-D-alanine-endopeptidase (penicillin-binding protein 4)